VPAAPNTLSTGSYIEDLSNPVGRSCNSGCGIYDTVVLDASQGSLCEVVIRGPVKNLVVKGNKNSYVSVVFQPNMKSNLGASIAALQGTNMNPIIDTQSTKKINSAIPSSSCYVNRYSIGCLRVGNIHKFEILGVGVGVRFNRIINNAKYFTLNQTKNVVEYGSPDLFDCFLPGSCETRQWFASFNSDTLDVSTFMNYGHFLTKTKSIGGFLKNDSNTDPTCSGKFLCRYPTGNNKYAGSGYQDCRTRFLVNLLIKCELSSTGRNKNFRIPLGILYLWTGAKVRLCNVSCECIKGPEPCECFDAVCYDQDATRAPLINCVAVVCGMSEVGPSVPLCPKKPSSSINWWNAVCNGQEDDASNLEGGFRDCLPSRKNCTAGICTDTCGGIGKNYQAGAQQVFGKVFGQLPVNPCFLNKVQFTIRCSDLVICELVKRVWTCPLACQCIDNASCSSDRPFVSTCYDQSYVKTSNPKMGDSDCNGNACSSAINSARVFTYLLDFDANTPALYFGGSLKKDAELNCSNINVQRLVFYQGDDHGDNGWPRPRHPGCGNLPYKKGWCTDTSGTTPNMYNNPATVFKYALMFSKCKDDPVMDPKTTLPRRCCNLFCEYTIPDRVRPYCGTKFAPHLLTSVCQNTDICHDTLNTVCNPVCPVPCQVLPSVPAGGKCCTNKVVLNEACCKSVKPTTAICVQSKPCCPQPTTSCTYWKAGSKDCEDLTSLSACGIDCGHSDDGDCGEWAMSYKSDEDISEQEDH
jgi:hypothetical protein